MALTLILIALATSGCSMSAQGGAFDQLIDGDVTGSIPALHAKAKQPTASDLALARSAASVVLTKGIKDASQPWENPATGARGSVTPVASAYAGDQGRTCRDFLASYVNGDTQSWLQGAACKSGHGGWEVETLRPWRQG